MKLRLVHKVLLRLVFLLSGLDWPFLKLSCSDILCWTTEGIATACCQTSLMIKGASADNGHQEDEDFGEYLMSYDARK